MPLNSSTNDPTAHTVDGNLSGFFFQSEEKICGFSTIFYQQLFCGSDIGSARAAQSGFKRRFIDSAVFFALGFSISCLGRAGEREVSERGESDVSIVCSAAVMTLIVALPDDICHQKVTD